MSFDYFKVDISLVRNSLKDLDLSHTEVLILIYLQSHDSTFTIYKPHIINWIGSNRKTVNRALESLMDKELILIEETEYRNQTTYRISLCDLKDSKFLRKTNRDKSNGDKSNGDKIIPVKKHTAKKTKVVKSNGVESNLVEIMPEGGLKVCEVGGKSNPEGGLQVYEKGGKSNPIVEKEVENLVEKEEDKYIYKGKNDFFNNFVERKEKHVFFDNQEDNELFTKALISFIKKQKDIMESEKDEFVVKTEVKLHIFEKIYERLAQFCKQINYDLDYLESSLEYYSNYFAGLQPKKRKKNPYLQFKNCLIGNWAKYKKNNKNMSFLEELKASQQEKQRPKYTMNEEDIL